MKGYYIFVQTKYTSLRGRGYVRVSLCDMYTFSFPSPGCSARLATTATGPIWAPLQALQTLRRRHILVEGGRDRRTRGGTEGGREGRESRWLAFGCRK